MIRLRSPNTVNVFGAVTSLPDRMVLVMELLPNGDLLTLLKKSKKPLPEKQARRIIGDICAGMAFLHSKNTVHGDLKSANVLLDGDDRAKVICRLWLGVDYSNCASTDFCLSRLDNAPMAPWARNFNTRVKKSALAFPLLATISRQLEVVLFCVFLSQIADFGTSRWTQSTNTTGLATYTTKLNQTTQMIIAWSAPEVRSLRTSVGVGFQQSWLDGVVFTGLTPGELIYGVDTANFVCSISPC